jgi:fluoride exporter
MTEMLAAGAGGFVGAVLRYWLAGVVQRWSSGVFPFGTLTVNVLGCLMLGTIMGLVEHRQLLGPHVRILLTIGFLGGFTTFSTFGFETFALLRDNEFYLALGNVVLSIVAGIGAVTLGWMAVKAVGV